MNTLRLTTLAVLAFAAFGCGPRVIMPLVKECNLPSDQTGTILGKRATLPVSIAVAPGIFSEEEITAIERAADVWNVFFQWSMGKKAIDYGSGKIPEFTGTQLDPTQATFCTQSDNGVVVISGTTNFTLGDPTGTLAVTEECTGSGSPYPALNLGIIVANFQSFFRNGNPISNFQNVMLHEMGHMLGLDHSCSTGGGTGIPDCDGGGINPSYLNAIMFPSDERTGGPEASFPNENDQGRMNCLYQGT